MGARNRAGIGLSYRPARLQRLTKLIAWNRFLGPIKVKNTVSGYIALVVSVETSIPLCEQWFCTRIAALSGSGRRDNIFHRIFCILIRIFKTRDSGGFFLAMNSSLYFRASIFFEANKGLIIIGTFYFNGALIS
jgi:hypothetical protein